MVSFQTKVFAFILALGGLLPANAFAEGNCTLPFDATSRISIQEMSEALAACAEAQQPTIWFEIADQGRYELLFSAAEGASNRKVTGIAHIGWEREIPLEIGVVFGFRAIAYVSGALSGETIEIVTYPPDGPNGPTTPEIQQQPLEPGRLEAALFLIGSDRYLLPGEWRIEIRRGKQILAAQRFTLVTATD